MLVAVGNGNRPDAVDIGILITDGVPTLEVETLESEEIAVKSLGIRLVAIGITEGVNDTLLLELVSEPPEKHYQHVSNFDALSSAINRLVMEACDLADSTPPPPVPGMYNTLINVRWHFKRLQEKDKSKLVWCLSKYLLF